MNVSNSLSVPEQEIILAGELNASAWDLLGPVIQSILTKAVHTIYLDLRQTHHATSGGLALIELLHTILQSCDGQLILLNPQGYLRPYLKRQNYIILDRPQKLRDCSS